MFLSYNSRLTRTSRRTFLTSSHLQVSALILDLTLTLRSAPFPGTLLTCHYLSRTKLHKSQPQISPYTSPYISTILDLSRMFIIISIVFIDPLCLHLRYYSGFVPRLPSKLRLLLRSRSRRESGISCSSSPESSASRCISSKDDPAGAADGAKSADGAPAGASK